MYLTPGDHICRRKLYVQDFELFEDNLGLVERHRYTYETSRSTAIFEPTIVFTTEQMKNTKMDGV